MNRITLNIDLDNNELLAEEVKKTLEADARRIAREGLQRVLTEETERVIKAAMDNERSALRIELMKYTAECVRKQLDDAGFYDYVVRGIIKGRMEEYGDKQVDRLLSSLESRIENRIRIYAKEVAESKFAQMIFDAINADVNEVAQDEQEAEITRE